ncbi:MAG: hypothetical protein ABJN62_04375 [Halioglobus sp.]
MKKRFDRAYLHIGMGKTGSTSIQQVFWANAERLESNHGIHYPKVSVHPNPRGQLGNHSEPLLCMFHPNPESLRRNILIGNDTAAKAQNFASELRASFELGFQKSNARELLLSAEGIPTYTARAVWNLAKWLSHWCEEIRLVACLRHPADALSSQIQQRVNVGISLEEMYQDPPFYPYAGLLPRLEKSFFDRKIHIYDFAEAVEDDSGLANRLLREIGCDFELPKPESGEANTSMSQVATQLLDSLNRQYPLIVDGKRNPARNGVELKWCRQMPGQKYRAPDNVYAALEERSAHDLQWIADNYKVKLRSRDRADKTSVALDPKQIDRLVRMLHRLSRCPSFVHHTISKWSGDSILGRFFLGRKSK